MTNTLNMYYSLNKKYNGDFRKKKKEKKKSCSTISIFKFVITRIYVNLYSTYFL